MTDVAFPFLRTIVAECQYIKERAHCSYSFFSISKLAFKKSGLTAGTRHSTHNSKSRLTGSKDLSISTADLRTGKAKPSGYIERFQHNNTAEHAYLVPIHK